MTKPRFPSIADVASELRLINANVETEDGDQIEGACDVRLQVYEDGVWVIRFGDPCYDTDHHGYWGAGSVPGVVNGVVKRFNSRDVARDLLEQAKDAHAESKV